jgi:hypothetical protein
MQMQLYRLRFLRAAVFGGLLLVAFIFCFYALMHLNSGKQSTQLTGAQRAALFTESADHSTVTFMNEGITNNDANHRSIGISVSSASVVLTIYQGYQKKVVSTQSFLNNKASYSVFLNSLYANGFLTSRTKAPVSSIDGQCAFGQKYTFSTVGVDNKVPASLWTTTCSGSGVGTFAGKTSNVIQLFQSQVPSYNQLVNQVDLFML